MNYPEALAYLRSFMDYERALPVGKLPTDYFLPRTTALLKDLGDPQRLFPCVIVAGTKGKGSTCAMLESVLRESGLRVGLWTSPHLHTYRERIQVDRTLISPQSFAALVEQMQPVVERFDMASYGGMPTTFEVSFALALSYFAAARVDVAVVEVGLGGRYDSSNVLTPVCSVIASISYDHMEILGHTLAEIAYDKAGIIKPGIPVITVPQQPEAATVIERVAREVGAELWITEGSRQSAVNSQQSAEDETRDTSREPRANWQPTDKGTPYALRTTYYTPSHPASRIPHPELALRGPFQQQNAQLAGTAAFVMRSRGFDISDEAIVRGLAQAQWPGRLEVVERAPLLVLDGAHNGDSAERLVEALRAEFAFERLVLVLGILKDKDIPAITRVLVPAADAIILTRPPGPRAPDDLDTLAQFIKPHLRGPLYVAPTMHEALTLARSLANPDDLICITGSLSTVAAAREALGLAEEHD